MNELHWVMVVERKPGLFGVLVNNDLEVFVRSKPISPAEIAERVGVDETIMLQPTCVQMTEVEIKLHAHLEKLDQFGVTGWNILYRESDLKAAGLLANQGV